MTSSHDHAAARPGGVALECGGVFADAVESRSGERLLELVPKGDGERRGETADPSGDVALHDRRVDLPGAGGGAAIVSMPRHVAGGGGVAQMRALGKIVGRVASALGTSMLYSCGSSSPLVYPGGARGMSTVPMTSSWLTRSWSMSATIRVTEGSCLASASRRRSSGTSVCPHLVGVLTADPLDSSSCTSAVSAASPVVGSFMVSWLTLPPLRDCRAVTFLIEVTGARASVASLERTADWAGGGGQCR